MKKKVSRELQALERRIQNLKQAVISKQGKQDFLVKIMDSAKTAQELHHKRKGGSLEDFI